MADEVLRAARHAEGLTLGAEWALWPDFVLRSAGFSVRGVDALCAPELSRLADGLLALEEQVRSALLAKLGADDSRSSKSRRKALAKLRRADHDVLPILRHLARDSALDLHRAQADADALEHQLAQAFEEVARRHHEELERRAAESSFREAIIWQNYRAFDHIRKNLRAKGKKARQAEEALAKYLQRYCTKNDTAGFYGPFQWARIDCDIDAIALKVGPEVTTRCRVYLEHWAVDAMAELAVAMPGVERVLAPRIVPLYSLRGDALWSPLGTVELAGSSAALLAAVDGERSAERIAAMLVAQGTFAGEQAVFDALRHCAAQGWIIWGRDIPTSGSPYERHLHAQLEAISDADLRERALAPLGRLEELRDAALAARGNPDAVEAALKELDATFEALTKRPATHRSGQVYAARTLSSMQCTRDVDLTLGKTFVDALRPLTLVLDSMRWLSFRLARAYRTEAGRIYRRLCDQTGCVDVPLMLLMAEMGPKMATVPGIAEVMLEFERNWEEVLDARETDSKIELSFEELAPRVAATFAVDGAGFPNARFHSPDVLIAATGPEAIERGDFLVVLGEIHPFQVTVESDLFIAEHPDRASMEAALRVAFPSGRPVPALNRTRALRTVTIPLGCHPLDAHIELPNGGRSSWPRDRTVAVSELVVRQEGDHLLLRERSGTRGWNAIALLFIFPPITFFGSQRTHAPRVTIDRFVLTRERWRLRAGDLTFTSLKDPCQRFVATRRWARQLNIPRRTFCKMPSEPKPTYLDLDAPHYVNLFCKAVRAEHADASFSISEMLPLPEQCWLKDADNDHYTSELRLIVRDLRPPADAERGLGSS